MLTQPRPGLFALTLHRGHQFIRQAALMTFNWSDGDKVTPSLFNHSQLSLLLLLIKVPLGGDQRRHLGIFCLHYSVKLKPHSDIGDHINYEHTHKHTAAAPPSTERSLQLEGMWPFSWMRHGCMKWMKGQSLHTMCAMVWPWAQVQGKYTEKAVFVPADS